MHALLGKLRDSQEDQNDSCKTKPFEPQSDQRVTDAAQNPSPKAPTISEELAAQVLGSAGRAIYDIINAACDLHHLDEAAKLLWKVYGQGEIGDDEATYLSSCIDRRRPTGRRTAPAHAA